MENEAKQASRGLSAIAELLVIYYDRKRYRVKRGKLRSPLAHG